MNRLSQMAALLLFSLTCVWSENLITSNAGFENGISSGGWNVYVDSANGAEATSSSISGGAQEGSRFCRIVVTKISPEKNWYVQLQDPSWTAEAGVEYHYSFYVKASGTRTIQVAAAGGPASNYAYHGGTDFIIGTTWKKIDYYFKSGVSGNDSLNFNIYCAYDTGTYDFDNAVLENSISSYPSTISVPSKGAWESGTYRNVFEELGYTKTQIDDKVNSAFQQLFFGNVEKEAIYTEVGADMGYINNPSSNPPYILTEGQSYGMMISVQMDRKDVFNRLWKFAYTKMLHHSGARKGQFAWRLYGTAPYEMEDKNPAPDGEEYFVTALLFAAQRWGNGQGIFDYQAQADSILFEMLHKEKNDTVVAEINTEHAMILFSPDARTTDIYTDPSYHLPAFYTIWSTFATNDKEFWKKMADTSRAYFKRACYPTTGLTSEYTAFDGTPHPVSFNRFSEWYHSDSWRVPMNIAMDYAWFKADDWQLDYTKRILNWLANQSGDYKQTYSIDGIPQSENEAGNEYYNAAPAQIACNAVAALACNDPIAWKYVDRLWKLPVTTGEWRYYHGLLTMLGLLHCSGKFKIWSSSALNANNSHLSNLHPVTNYVSGQAEILDPSGRIIAKVDLGKSRSLAALDAASLLSLARIKMSSGICIIRTRGTDGNLIIKQLPNVR